MSDPKTGKRHLSTRAIHAGNALNETNALTPPIYQSATFKLDSAAAGAEFSQAIAPKEFYTRWGNPTTKQLEAVMADLEGSAAALAFSSGMGALTALFFSHLKAGDHAIVGESIYSGVSELASQVLPRYGIECSTADARDIKNVERALKKNSRLILVETPTNPTLDLCDLRELARLGSATGVTTAVDSTFATPVNQQPLRLGIDVVVHAATKYIGGHSDATGGILCSSQKRIERAWYYLKLFGSCLSPFEAWLFLRGLKTLGVRVKHQNDSALELARFLEDHPEVVKVNYPGLASHPQHGLATEQMDGFGGIVSFDLGGYEAGVRLVESLQLIQLAVSLGGVESIIQHPASMTHGMLSDEALQKSGIAPGLLRLSVGVEDWRDLRADLEQALGRKKGVEGSRDQGIRERQKKGE